MSSSRHPLRKLIAAILPKKPEPPAPEPVVAKPAPPAPKPPPPIQVISLPKGVGTQLRRAVAAEPSSKVKSVIRRAKTPPPVQQAPPEKGAMSTRHGSKRTRKRDFPVI